MDLEINIRPEQAADHDLVFELVKSAFTNQTYSSQTEHFIVEKLRKSDAFIPELSLVAEINGQIVGHILISKVVIKNEQHETEALSLAPVSVLPSYQKQGIGSQLILEAHNIAKSLGYDSVFLVGHSDYYPRFGYRPSIGFDIKFPFESAAENCMAVELVAGSLNDVSGLVVYPEGVFD